MVGIFRLHTGQLLVVPLLQHIIVNTPPYQKKNLIIRITKKKIKFKIVALISI